MPAYYTDEYTTTIPFYSVYLTTIIGAHCLRHSHPIAHDKGIHPSQTSQTKIEKMDYGGYQGNGSSSQWSTAYSAPRSPAGSRSRIELRGSETTYFPQLFELVCNKSSNRAEGKNTIAFLRKSKLGNDVLKRIWTLAAKSNPVSLDREEFFVVLRLVALAQAGRDVSEAALNSGQDVPLPHLDSVPPPPAAHPQYQQQQSHAVAGGSGHGMSQDEFDKYSTMFDRLDSTRQGFISTEKMAEILKNTNLPGPTLKKLWLLTAPESGNFDRSATVLLLHLLAKHKAGNEIPANVPAELRSSIQLFSGAGRSAPSATPLSSTLALPAPPSAARTSDDPFAEITSDSYGGGGSGSKATPLYSYPQIAAAPAPKPAPPPAYPTRGLDRMPPPPPSMQPVLPRSGGTRVERGPKIDPNMRGVLEEQDSELYVPAGKAAVEGSVDSGDQLKSYTEQLSAFHTERTKLRKSIATQKAALAKEEDFLRHYQSQISKTIDEYVQTTKELEELLTKRVTALETRPAPSFSRSYDSSAVSPSLPSPVYYQPTAAATVVARTSPAQFTNPAPAPPVFVNNVSPVRRPSENKAQQYQPAAAVPQTVPYRAQTVAPSPAKRSPQEEQKRAPSASPPQFGQPDFDEASKPPAPFNGGNAGFDWGAGGAGGAAAGGFSNAGVHKAQPVSQPQAMAQSQGQATSGEPEFDFS